MSSQAAKLPQQTNFREPFILLGLLVAATVVSCGVAYFFMGRPRGAARDAQKISFSASRLVAGNPDNWRGNKKATTSLVVFTDYQCPACRALDERLAADNVRLPFRYTVRNLPLPMHTRAYEAAVAAEEGRLQGAFWQTHDILMQGNGAMAEKFQAVRRRFGANKSPSDSVRRRARASVDDDLKMAGDLHLDSTPSLFLARSDSSVYRVFSLKQARDLSH